jgi:hypothetical protein
MPFVLYYGKPLDDNDYTKNYLKITKENVGIGRKGKKCNKSGRKLSREPLS